MSKTVPPCSDGPYLSRTELAARWRCSPASVDRYTRAAGMTRLCLGSGRNGAVRFLRKEVEAYEQSRQVRMT